MITNGVVPIHKIVKILELEPMFFVKIIPFFDFAIGLGMLKSGFDMLDSRALEKRLEAAFAVAVFIFLVGLKPWPPGIRQLRADF
jgi:hypothetical protein